MNLPDVDQIEPQDIPAILGELEHYKALLWVKMLYHSPKSDEWVSPKEAAKLLHVSPKHVYDLTKSGKLPSVKWGRSVRIRRSDL